MALDCDPQLHTVGINILGRFLVNRENNIRYIALSSLCKIVTNNNDASAIQRYRNTIVDCLKDADISIRKRALDLLYSLVNSENIHALMTELINYLEMTSFGDSFRGDLVLILIF